MLPVGRNRAESGQRERDLWPRGNTAPETTLLSGYGVDTLRWADNVRGTPGKFQRGADPQGKGAVPGWGTSPTLLLTRAWPGTPSPAQFYTRRGSMRSQSPGSPRSPSGLAAYPAATGLAGPRLLVWLISGR